MRCVPSPPGYHARTHAHTYTPASSCPGALSCSSLPPMYTYTSKKYIHQWHARVLVCVCSRKSKKTHNTCPTCRSHRVGRGRNQCSLVPFSSACAPAKTNRPMVQLMREPMPAGALLIGRPHPRPRAPPAPGTLRTHTHPYVHIHIHFGITLSRPRAPLASLASLASDPAMRCIVRHLCYYWRQHSTHVLSRHAIPALEDPGDAARDESLVTDEALSPSAPSSPPALCPWPPSAFIRNPPANASWV